MVGPACLSGLPILNTKIWYLGLVTCMSVWEQSRRAHSPPWPGAEPVMRARVVCPHLRDSLLTSSCSCSPGCGNHQHRRMADSADQPLLHPLMSSHFQTLPSPQPSLSALWWYDVMNADSKTMFVSQTVHYWGVLLRQTCFIHMNLKMHEYDD